MSHISKTNFKFFKFLRDSCIKYIGQSFKIISSALLMKIPQSSHKIMNIWKEIYLY